MDKKTSNIKVYSANKLHIVDSINRIWLCFVSGFTFFVWRPRASVLTFLLFALATTYADQVPDLYLYYYSIHWLTFLMQFLWVVFALSTWSLAIYVSNIKIFSSSNPELSENIRTHITPNFLAILYASIPNILFLGAAIASPLVHGTEISRICIVLAVSLLSSSLFFLILLSARKFKLVKSESILSNKSHILSLIGVFILYVAFAGFFSSMVNEITEENTTSVNLPSMTIGSFAICFLFFAFVVFFIGGLNFFSDSKKFPFTVAFVFLGFVGGWSANDHNIKFLFNNTGKALSTTVFSKKTNDYDEWYKKQINKNTSVYFVAAAGGGIRAAYWTAGVLHELCKQTKMKSEIIGASTVSGGTLGVASFMLDNQVSADGCNDGNSANDKEYTNNLNNDYLADVLAGLFFSEIANRLTFGVFGLRNRGEFLSGSWNNSWWNIGESSESLLKFYDGNRKMHLLFNSTDAITGKRVIHSDLNLKQSEDAKFSKDVIEFSSFAGCSHPDRDARRFNIYCNLLLSETVLNSARFPYFSPPGNYRNLDKNLQLVDGGYFDNYGAETLLELLQSLEPELHKVNVNVIQISNDKLVTCDLISAGKEDYKSISSECEAVADKSENDIKDCKKKLSPDSNQLAFNFTSDAEQKCHDLLNVISQGEIGVPIKGIFSTREGRGILATKRLHAYAIKKNYNFYHFPFSKDMNAPLGWTLSNSVREKLDQAARKQVREFIKIKN